jgi:hypothetical protein
LKHAPRPAGMRPIKKGTVCGITGAHHVRRERRLATPPTFNAWF